MSQAAIILLERVRNLGVAGDVVKVKPGYARNYLLPFGKAVRYSEKNMDEVNSNRDKLKLKHDTELVRLHTVMEKCSEITEVNIESVADGAGHLYATVHASDVASELSKLLGLEVDQSIISLPQKIKMLGIYEMTLHFADDQKLKIALNVVRSHSATK